MSGEQKTVSVPVDLLVSIWAEMYHGVGGEHGIDDAIAQWNLDQVVDILASANALPDVDPPPPAESGLGADPVSRMEGGE